VIRSILHPTDLSPASYLAFCHALRLAVAARAKLNFVHVAPDTDGVHREDFPAAGSRRDAGPAP